MLLSRLVSPYTAEINKRSHRVLLIGVVMNDNKTGLPNPAKPSAQNLLVTPTQQSLQLKSNKEAMLATIKRRLDNSPYEK